MDIAHMDSELFHEMMQHGALKVAFESLYIDIGRIGSELLHEMI